MDVNFDMLEFLEKAEPSENLQTYVTGRKRYQFLCAKKLQFPIKFTSDNFSHKFPGHQGSIDCGILASGMEGSGDRERNWEGKFHRQELKMAFLHYIS